MLRRLKTGNEIEMIVKAEDVAAMADEVNNVAVRPARSAQPDSRRKPKQTLRGKARPRRLKQATQTKPKVKTHVQNVVIDNAGAPEDETVRMSATTQTAILKHRY